MRLFSLKPEPKHKRRADKARVSAKDLGVRLVRITNFSESEIIRAILR